MMEVDFNESRMEAHVKADLNWGKKLLHIFHRKYLNNCNFQKLLILNFYLKGLPFEYYKNSTSFRIFLRKNMLFLHRFLN